MNKKMGILAVIAIICIGIYTIIELVAVIKINTREFEYAKDGVIGKSNDCYQNDKEQCFCKIGNNYVFVDNYYEVEE